MTSMKLRKMFVLGVILISTGFCLFIMLNRMEICIFCPKKYETFSYKRENGIFLLLPDIDCSRNTPFLLILVTTFHSQTKSRMAIRETWGKETAVANKGVVTYFLLGISSKPSDQFAIAAENLKYGDIIQKDFIDTYYNLTLKTMMGIQWVHNFCPQSSFVMKTDTDMFINTGYLIELILKKNSTTRFFTGFLKLNESPIRNIFSKWFVNYKEYPGHTYPPFCSGTGYVFSTDVASQVLNISESVPYLKLEDVFVGLCLAKLNIIPEELHSKQTFFPERVRFSPCGFKKIVTSHCIKPHELLLYWKIVEKTRDEECPMTD